jgi:uncharacterized FAD-dependent dehydrogenase
VAASSPSQRKIVIVGTGPAGLFAAFELVKNGYMPIILEQGKKVEQRKKDIVALQRDGVLNESSNYCFGEGGAGTFSDGKLYTRSNKRGSIEKVLQTFVYFGASPEILYDSHPHIGSDKLPVIIAAMRSYLTNAGCEFYFETKVVDFVVRGGRCVAVVAADGKEFYCDDVILASGHSSSDIYRWFAKRSYALEQKSFALGVRVEHPQDMISHLQYGCAFVESSHAIAETSRMPVNFSRAAAKSSYALPPAALLHSLAEPLQVPSPAATPPAFARTPRSLLPPAEYRFAEQVDGRGVFSFCMCPGGVLVPSMTQQNTLVLNGMSSSARSSRWANAGMVVTVSPSDYGSADVCAGLLFREELERKFFETGSIENSCGFSSPAQRITDFVSGKRSANFPSSADVYAGLPFREELERKFFEAGSIENSCGFSNPDLSRGLDLPYNVCRRGSNGVHGSGKHSACPNLSLSCNANHRGMNSAFGNGESNTDLPRSSYPLGIYESDFRALLPPFIIQSLQQAFKQIDKKRKGFITEEAIVTGLESRTSSPVRILRNNDTFSHIEIVNLYPCGEGAGYAGGITSSAIDGINTVNALINKLC